MIRVIVIKQTIHCVDVVEGVTVISMKLLLLMMIIMTIEFDMFFVCVKVDDAVFAADAVDTDSLSMIKRKLDENLLVMTLLPFHHVVGVVVIRV